jgi:hypothetical protein
LVGNRGGSFGRGEGLGISWKNVAHDLLLDERRIPGKFGSAGTYGVQMLPVYEFKNFKPRRPIFCPE